MSYGQVRLIKWSLPALTLILGLFWYKRRRVDRVDPGGSSSQKAIIADEGAPKLPSSTDQTSEITILLDKVTCKQHESSFNGENSFDASRLLCSKNQKVQPNSETPRKTSTSLDIPGRSDIQSAFSSAPWYDVEEDEEEMEEIKKRSPITILSTQPDKEYSDLLSKSHSSAELLANTEAMNENQSEQKRQIKQAKIVVANGQPKIHEFHPKENEKSQQLQNATNLYDNASVQEEVKNNEPVENQQVNEEAGGDEKKQSSQSPMERDSANHSPVSGVLDGSVTDEARSEGEGSTDSGKGGSINGRRGKDNRTFYEFFVPPKLVGKLIGKGGRFMEQVRKKANVGIVVKTYPSNDNECQICSISGTPENITIALGIIRKHFPEKIYPQLTLEQIIYNELLVPDEIAWVPELVPLRLIEGLNNDVVICYLDKPNHLFLQLHAHSTYSSLQFLSSRLNEEYNLLETPPLPDQLNKGMIAVGKVNNQWLRVMIEKPDSNGQEILVLLVDHGGYHTLSKDNLRQIHADFLTVPLQAIEVNLDIQPQENEWSQQAYDVVTQLSNNRVGQAQVTGYTDLNIQCIKLYYNIRQVGYIDVAEELKARGLAVPLPSSLMVEEEVPQEAALPDV